MTRNDNEKEALRQAYNNFAEQRNQAQMEPWKFKERQSFLQTLAEEDKNSILELGSGTGRDGAYFKENRFDVVCVDLSDEMVRLCLEKGLDARRADFGSLDFAPEQFEAVYAMNSLLHVPKSDLDEILDQIYRVLKPGGLFFFGVYGGDNSEGIWENDPYEPKRYFSMYEDEELVEAAKRWFAVEDFHTVELQEGKPHFQSLLLRKE
ncbi:class I SAM-dependent DNA methyltransferase [Cohnella lupini]|uniref:Methyltransferase family protein n=1 Tax=Cohnella lupini TaxID=1294267 RepID=A0A3D9IAH8_9BACL|nr:class I SAM-dependent methyltransferase [Cohnella lupini]RED58539.1 methyltransferase family protein [Cohnella lupini]